MDNLHAIATIAAALVVAAGCSSDTNNTFVSASRLSIKERSSVEIRVSGAKKADLEPLSLNDVEFKTVDATDGVALTITPGCDAARGGDMEVPIQIRDLASGKSATVILAIEDDPTCLAEIAIWDIACTSVNCLDLCGVPPDPLPGRLTMPRGAQRKLCAKAIALDTSRPITDEALHTDVDSPNFTAGLQTGPELFLQGNPEAVGTFDVIYTALAGGEPVTSHKPLDLGSPGDFGVEFTKATLQELARTDVSVWVHHFVAAPCQIKFGVPPGPTFFTYNARLYDTNGTSIGMDDPSLVLDCSQPHVHFTLAIVPTSDAADPMTVAINAGETPDLAMYTPTFPVKSRVETLGFVGPPACPATDASALACADFDGDSALDLVVSDGKGNTCISGLPGFRATALATLTGGMPRSLFPVYKSGRSELYGFDDKADGGSLYKFAPPSTGQQARWLFVASALGTQATLLASTLGGQPDALATRVGTQIRFTSLTGAPIGLVDTTNTVAVITGIGTLSGGSGLPDQLLVVTDEPKIYTYSVTWPDANGTTLALTLRRVPELLMDIPPVQEVHIASRVSPAPEGLVLLYSGLYSSAVVEVSNIGGYLTAYGGVRSVASTPDGSALVGAAGGSSITRSAAGGIVTSPLDPIPEQSQQYGRAITPCVRYAPGTVLGSPVEGFAVSTSGGVQVELMGIVPEQP